MRTSLSLWNMDLPSVIVHIRPCQENFIWEVIPGSTAGEGKIGKGKKPTRDILLSRFHSGQLGADHAGALWGIHARIVLPEDGELRHWLTPGPINYQLHSTFWCTEALEVFEKGFWRGAGKQRLKVELSQDGNYLPQLQVKSSQPRALFLFIIIVPACSSQEAWGTEKIKFHNLISQR